MNDEHDATAERNRLLAERDELAAKCKSLAAESVANWQQGCAQIDALKVENERLRSGQQYLEDRAMLAAERDQLRAALKEACEIAKNYMPESVLSVDEHITKGAMIEQRWTGVAKPSKVHRDAQRLTELQKLVTP